LLEIAPRSISAHNNRAVLLYALGRYQEALAGFRRTEELELFGVDQAQIEIFNQVATLLALGRDTEAATTAQKLQGPFAQYSAELLATYRGEWSAAASTAFKLADDPSTPSWVRTPSTTMLAGSRAARGELGMAERQLRAAAVESADLSVRHWFTNALLLLAAASGRAPGPVPSWLNADTTAGGLLAGGLWAAMVADTVTARTRLEQLQRRREVQRRRLVPGMTLLGAYIYAADGHWDQVAGHLRAAAIAGERDGGDLDQVSSPALRWLMAEAYQRIGKPDSAKVMYQMAIDPTHLPFSHLALRGLVHSFASRRLALLEGGGSRRMQQSGS
jgi:tetratricopeptide (TPR) repeat protein